MKIRATFGTSGGEHIILGVDEGASTTLHILTHDHAQELSSQVGEALEAMARHRIAKAALFPHPSAKGAPHVELVKK